MLLACRKPFFPAGGNPFGCGQCMPCRISRRSIWTTRQQLESYAHVGNSFLTLTYDDEHLPRDESLQPAHLSSFVKRLRKRNTGTPLRFYAVGEYGDQTGRPHYHLSLFGMSGITGFISKYEIRHFGISESVQKSWPYGFTLALPFTRETAQYTAGYVTKKLTQAGDPRLHGRSPEFARMSNRPGIGHSSLQALAENTRTSRDLSSGRAVRINGRIQLIGPYLSRKLLELKEADPKKIQEYKDEKSMERSLVLQGLLQAAEPDPLNISTRQKYQALVLQKIRNIESRYTMRPTRQL